MIKTTRTLSTGTVVTRVHFMDFETRRCGLSGNGFVDLNPRGEVIVIAANFDMGTEGFKLFLTQLQDFAHLLEE